MESKSFNTTESEKLIECIRNYPVLFKLSDKNYKDNSIREHAWKEIAHFIGKNVNDCKTRWRTIRDSYKKNLKKRKLGTGSVAPTKSKYNDYALSFLDNIEDERRTMLNIDIDCNDHLNYSEVLENECFNQTAQSEFEEMSGSNSDVITLEKDIPIVHQPLESEIRDSLTDTFRKPYKKQNEIGTKDKKLEEIRKGREERLAALKEMSQGELSNDPIQIFFKSMASTVATFPPELAVEAKTKVFNIISEMELRALKAKASYTSSVETMASASYKPSKVVPTVFIEGDSSSSATTISSISENSISSATAVENSTYAYLQYYNNDYIN